MKAARQNQKTQLISETYSMTIAVMHSLDVGFNKGKGNILGSWMDAMNEIAIDENKKPVKELFTERTQSFFDSLPKVSKKKEE